MLAFRFAAAAVLMIFAVPAAAQPGTVTIDVQSFSFAPRPISFRAGQPVTLAFVNRSGGGHDFTAAKFFATSRIVAGAAPDGEIELAPHADPQHHAGAQRRQLQGALQPLPAQANGHIGYDHRRLNSTVTPAKAGVPLPPKATELVCPGCWASTIDSGKAGHREIDPTDRRGAPARRGAAPGAGSGAIIRAQSSAASPAASRWPTAQAETLQPVMPPRTKRSFVAIVAGMTLEQKVGQMTQPNIWSVTPDDVRRYYLGSVLNGGGAWPGNNKHASVADWLALSQRYLRASMSTDMPVKIPMIWGPTRSTATTTSSGRRFSRTISGSARRMIRRC